MAQVDIGVADSDVGAACFCPPARGLGRGRLPAEGQRVCVTLLRDLELWQENKRVFFPDGACYEGAACAIIDDGLFDLLMDNGQKLRFYARDPALTIELFDETG